LSNLGPLHHNPTGVQDTSIVSPNPIPVTISGLPAYTSTWNQYSEALVPFNTETTILSHLVTSTFYILGIEGWGDTCGEFFIKVDGTIVGGSRTTAAIPTCFTNYTSAPIQVNAGSIVTITATHYVPTTHTMRTNLFGGII
jgi:hypothetical protein